MDTLVAANLLQKRKAPAFANPAVENHYYQTHSPRGPRLSSLLPIAAVAAVLAFILDISAR